MGEAGVLTEDDRVELLEGWIVQKMNHNPQHDSCVDLTDEALRRRLPSGWRIRIQSAITTSDSEPEPDIAVVRGTARDFAKCHPGPADIGLIVEVADSSLAKDRRKRRLYAAADIQVYWIVNLVDSRLEVYADPSGATSEPAYRREDYYTIEQSVRVTIDGQEIDHVPVADLFP